MSDIGHNSGEPQPFITIDNEALRQNLGDRYADRLARVRELEKGALAISSKWGGEGFPDDEVAARAADWVSKQVKPALDQIDAARVREKADVLAAQRTIDGFFKGLADPLDACVKIAADAGRKWLAEKRRRAEVKQREEAEAASLAAEKAAAVAAVNPDSDAALDAAIEAEQKALEAATPAPTSTKAHVRSDQGSLMSGRVKWTFRLVDITKVPAHLLLVNDTLANAAIRSAPKKDGVPQIVIPGLEIVAEDKVSFR